MTLFNLSLKDSEKRQIFRGKLDCDLFSQSRIFLLSRGCSEKSAYTNRGRKIIRRLQQTKQLTTKHGSFISIQYYPFNLSPLMSTSWMKTHVDNNITKRRVLYPYIDSGGQVRTTVWKFFSKSNFNYRPTGGPVKNIARIANALQVTI